MQISSGKFRPGCNAVSSCSWSFTPYRDGANEMDIFLTELNLPNDAYINIYSGTDSCKNHILRQFLTIFLAMELVSTITGTDYSYLHLTGEKVLLEYQGGSNPTESNFTAILHNGGCVGGETVYYTKLQDNISDGSYGGPYLTNSYCSFIISPPIPQMVPIQLTMNWVSVEATYDFVYIYDGDNVEAPTRAAYTGKFKDEVFYSTGDTMLVVLASDYTVTWDGFSMSYKVGKLRKFLLL